VARRAARPRAGACVFIAQQSSDPAATASTTLTVAPAPAIKPVPPTSPTPPSCKTIALKGTTLTLAKRLVVALSKRKPSKHTAKR
jgi:hypothetical protein